MAKGKLTPQDEFGIAESLGQIMTMPEINEATIQPTKETSFVDTPEEFRMAIGALQMSGEDTLEVGPKLFKYLLKNSKTPYLTYGSPGIKVYLQGTKKECDRVDKLSAEAYIDYVAKQKELGLM